MRVHAPDAPAARDPVRYWQVLADLEAYAAEQRFEGVGSFYAWERLNILVGRLKGHFDAYELEGDSAPLRAEVASYHADLWRLHVRPDGRVFACLEGLLRDLEPAPAVVTIATSSVPPAPAVPTNGFWAVSPAALVALHGAPEGSPLPPGA